MSPSPLKSALAAAVFVAMLALAPSSALAHAGHVHIHSGVTQPAKPDAKAAAATQELTELTAVGHSPDDSECDTRGCCGSGPCTGCHGGLLLVSVPTATPSAASTVLLAGEAMPRDGPETARLRRPPKAFA